MERKAKWLIGSVFQPFLLEKNQHKKCQTGSLDGGVVHLSEFTHDILRKKIGMVKYEKAKWQRALPAIQGIPPPLIAFWGLQGEIVMGVAIV
eukprot:1105381-Pelagomonas_calceolata.AAC.3